MILNIYLTLALIWPIMFLAGGLEEYRAGKIRDITLYVGTITFGSWVVATLLGILYWIWS